MIDVDKRWTVNNCYRLYELVKLIANRSKYRYSRTKNEEYLKIGKEATKILIILDEKDLSEINLDDIHDKVCELYLRMRRVKRQVRFYDKFSFSIRSIFP